MLGMESKAEPRRAARCYVLTPPHEPSTRPRDASGRAHAALPRPESVGRHPRPADQNTSGSSGRPHRTWCGRLSSTVRERSATAVPISAVRDASGRMTLLWSGVCRDARRAAYDLETTASFCPDGAIEGLG